MLQIYINSYDKSFIFFVKQYAPPIPISVDVIIVCITSWKLQNWIHKSCDFPYFSLTSNLIMTNSMSIFADMGSKWQTICLKINLSEAIKYNFLSLCIYGDVAAWSWSVGKSWGKFLCIIAYLIQYYPLHKLVRYE